MFPLLLSNSFSAHSVHYGMLVMMGQNILQHTFYDSTQPMVIHNTQFYLIVRSDGFFFQAHWEVHYV